MDSSNGNEKLKQQIESLRSSNRRAILDTLKELRFEGDVSVLPELFNLMLDQEDMEILDEICALLNDLKEKEAAEILAEAIRNPEYKEIHAHAQRACQAARAPVQCRPHGAGQRPLAERHDGRAGYGADC